MRNWEIYATLLLIALGLYLIYRLRESGKEHNILLRKLNSSDLYPTIVVDQFARSLDTVCTRFMCDVPHIINGKSYSAHLSVFLGTKCYWYGKVGGKWKFIKIS